MSFDISPTGVWLCNDTGPHSFDRQLASAIGAELIRSGDTRVIDFGCGSGAYVKYLCDAGLDALGYDGNPFTSRFNERCKVLDLTLPLPQGFAPADAVLCLETGEHIPREYEDQFIKNITSMADNVLILSWFPRDGHGTGHVNPRPNYYIMDKIKERGFVFDDECGAFFREESTLWWFKESLMVFRRV